MCLSDASPGSATRRSRARATLSMNHRGARHAKWKGLAMARVQVGLTIVMINTPKLYKIIHNQLVTMTLRPAA